jgi:hypothetical protein
MIQFPTGRGAHAQKGAQLHANAGSPDWVACHTKVLEHEESMTLAGYTDGHVELEKKLAVLEVAKKVGLGAVMNDLAGDGRRWLGPGLPSCRGGRLQPDPRRQLDVQVQVGPLLLSGSEGKPRFTGLRGLRFTVQR